jgi:hypothetical protein
MMHPAGEPVALRPLSLGEIFDRALTLYVRNAALFTLIALVLVLPLAVVQYFIGLHESDSFSQLLAQIQHPGSVPAQKAGGVETALAIAMVVLAVVLNAFAVVAIAAAVGRLYRAQAVDWRACYAQALRRSAAIVVTLLAEIATLFAVFFAGIFAVTAVLVVAFLFVRASAPLGVIAAIAGAIVGVAWFIAILLCYVAYGFAFDALGVEGAAVGQAIASGFARVFNRSELLRAVLVCLALLVIYLGFAIVSITLAATLETMHLHLVNVAVNAVLSLISTALLGVLLAVYYFDVRVRREGLDMQAELEGLIVAPSP